MQTAKLVRFGPFEIAVRSGDLRKHGVRIRLQEQSLQILLMLLEHPGEVVLRADIQQRLWSDNTVVDFDQSINAAVGRLRGALGDSASAPRYIETVSKRGYRFLGEIERIGEAAPEQNGHIPAAATTPPEHPAPDRGRHMSPWVVAVASVTLLLGIAYGVYALRPNRPKAPVMHPVPLTTFPGHTVFAAFSPDGQRVAFSWVGPPNKGTRRPLSIYVKHVGNDDPVQVTDSPMGDSLPQWSPDGSQIAFQRTTPAGHELYIVAALGGAPRKIADMGIGLAWSPDGSEIAYVAPYPPAGSGGILVRSLATGQTRELTNPKPYADGLVAWSPDGNQIAFGRTFTESARELFVAPSRGGAARRLTFDQQATEGFTWTPDSRELVFISYRYGGPNLWRIGAGGGEPEQVVSMAHHPSYPNISRRGNRLVFTEEFGDSNIWQYERSRPANGPTPAPFASPKCLLCSTVEDDSPRYSPDGRKIVFVSKRSGSDEIWVAGADGSGPIQLTAIKGAPTGSPRWSYDGRWIAFDSRMRGGPDVFVMSAQGGTVRQLTSEPSSDIEPSWSHDGRWIYFASNRGGQFHVWKVAFEGGAARQVTQDRGGECLESPDGKRLYYFRDDRDGLWTVPVDGGREEVVPELGSLPHTRAWTVRDEGIYFHRDGPGSHLQVQFFSFATHHVTTLLEPERTLRISPGLDVSPDARRLLYTQTDQKVEELMMIENFR